MIQKHTNVRPLDDAEIGDALPEMLAYYADKGCEVRTLEEYQNDV
jgi:hypothetical protein